MANRGLTMARLGAVTRSPIISRARLSALLMVAASPVSAAVQSVPPCRWAAVSAASHCSSTASASATDTTPCGCDDDGDA
ncbi:hypothetical protein [Nonomuraea sp. KM88]|uniref:hypothetical protein n=1 Tax=Nonomuraea sp. KM88 TaxID=3457427 RepID=UPI003FCC306E